MTALKLIRQHGCIENILENINKERCFGFCKMINLYDSLFQIENGSSFFFLLPKSGLFNVEGCFVFKSAEKIIKPFTPLMSGMN